MFVSPPSLREKLPELPLAVEEVVLRALAKDPKERFATVQAFATALEQACQVGLPHPIALQSDLPSPNQPSSSDTVVAFPAHQVSEPPNARTSAPSPAKVLSTTPLAESFSATNLQSDENATPVSRTRRNSALVNRHQSLHTTRRVLLICLALLILLGSVGLGSVRLFNIMRTNQLATSDAYATAQTHATNIAGTATIVAQVHAAASATATAQYLNYVQATSGTPALDDPLRDNSQGHEWAETGGNNGTCIFTAGGYHAIIQPAFSGGIGCFDHSDNFSNLAYQVEMTIIKGGGGGGLLFRNGGGPDPNGWGYQFGLFQDHVGLWYGGTTFSSSTAIKAKLNQTYLLTAIARGNTIDVYIDKRWVGSTKDNTSSSGSIGLSVYGQANFTEVVFRNVKVWIS